MSKLVILLVATVVLCHLISSAQCENVQELIAKLKTTLHAAVKQAEDEVAADSKATGSDVAKIGVTAAQSLLKLVQEALKKIKV